MMTHTHTDTHAHTHTHTRAFFLPSCVCDCILTGNSKHVQTRLFSNVNNIDAVIMGESWCQAQICPTIFFLFCILSQHADSKLNISVHTLKIEGLFILKTFAFYSPHFIFIVKIVLLTLFLTF